MPGQRATTIEMITHVSYRTQGAGASRVHAGAVRAGGWGWLRVGRGTGRGAVRRPVGLRADVPQNLGDTQDIHHHLLRVSKFL